MFERIQFSFEFEDRHLEIVVSITCLFMSAAFAILFFKVLNVYVYILCMCICAHTYLYIYTYICQMLSLSCVSCAKFLDT